MKRILAIVGIFIIFVACEDKEVPKVPTSSSSPTNNNTTSSGTGTGGTSTGNGGTSTGNNSSEWLIPINEVIDGGPGKDGIPALVSPNLINANQNNYVSDNDLVIGYKSGNTTVAYPHIILDWHEIVNDNVNGDIIALTYCPLTGTGIAWERVINNITTTFGVSGLLYNNNLIPYDRLTDSNWSQIRLDCVNGSLSGTKIKTFQVVETTWGNWKSMYPASKVLSNRTGHNRSYGVYPYGDYKTNNDFLLFPLSIDDKRLDRKERVHGVILDGQAKAYRFDSFSSSVTMIEDIFQSQKLVIVGSTLRNFIVSFIVPDDLIFTALDENNIILFDNEGNKWDIFGYAVEGPRAGERLTPTTSFMGYWFAWGAFYPSPNIYQ